MDKFREAMDITSQRIIKAESCLLVLDNKRTELKKENETLKKRLAEYEAKAQAEEDPKELTLYNTDGEEVTIDEWEARWSRRQRKVEMLD
jgi:predicted  nucleic acid-binding Zn-ribbon protein